MNNIGALPGAGQPQGGGGQIMNPNNSSAIALTVTLGGINR